MPLKVVCQCDGCGQNITAHDQIVRVERGHYIVVRDEEEWCRWVKTKDTVRENYHDYCHIGKVGCGRC